MQHLAIMVHNNVSLPILKQIYFYCYCKLDFRNGTSSSFQSHGEQISISAMRALYFVSIYDESKPIISNNVLYLLLIRN